MLDALVESFALDRVGATAGRLDPRKLDAINGDKIRALAPAELVERTMPFLARAGLATGTGDIAYSLAARGARVVGLDITPRMIELAAAKRTPAGSCTFVVGDMLALPFPDRAFDLVTTGYGLRNVPDLHAAVDEIARVLAPGGVALSLDFNRPGNRVVRQAYLLYLTIVGSLLGWILHGNPDTYRYIPESIRNYPGAKAVASMLTHFGFVEVRVIPVLGGLMAIHVAKKPL